MPPLSFLAFVQRREPPAGLVLNADHQERYRIPVDLFGSGLTDAPRDSDFAYVKHGPAENPSRPNYYFGPPWFWQYDTFLPPEGRIFQVMRAAVAHGSQYPFVDRQNNDVPQDTPNSFSRITDRLRGKRG